MANITGNQNPRVGETNYYSVNSFTAIIGLNTQYEWYLYKKQSNGKWKDITETPKKGNSVPYTFYEICLGIEMRIEVYETRTGILQNKPIKNKIGEILVIPTSAKTPQILKVVLFNRGAKDINKASYMDTLVAQAHCVGLFNQEIEFNLWEDDAPKGGHNAEINKNNKAPRTYKARVNAKGIAEAKISLATDEKILRQIANKYRMKGDKDEGANHEFYVTASYTGKIRGASQVNVSVKNPDDKNGTQTPQPQTSKPKPKDNTPKFPATTNSKTPGKPDPQGKIIDAYFVNSNGQKLQRIKVGEKLRVRVSSKGMKDKHIQYVIWEYDTTSNDEVYRSQRIKLGYDLADMPEITISPNVFKKGIDLIYGDPDEETQNYFIEVIPLDVSTESSKFGVTSDGLMKVENAKSPAVVKNNDSDKKSEGGCPRCKILTKEEIDKIFTTASENDKKALFSAFNDGNLKFEINTCLRKAHFFAQVLAEVGTNLKLSEPESFNYSARRLKDGDFVKGTGWVKDLTNGGHYMSGTWKSSPFSYFKTHHKEANLYGRKDLNKYNDNGIQAANSKEIANLVYADENREPKYRLGNTQDGDGWKFMGKGIIQVTGRSNYTEVNKRLEKKGFNFDIVNNPNNVLKHKESVLSSMAFWYWKDLQLKSDKGGKEVVDNITKEVNEATPTYPERRENFDKTYSIFQVNKCSLVQKEEESKSEGKWRMPIDNPMLCLYSQKGGDKPWHGSFGENIRDGVSNHAGVDLLAIPETPVYACLEGKIERVYTSTSLAGRTIVIKITDTDTFKKLKRNYQPLYKDKGEILEKNFNHDGEIFFVFMHLSKFGKFRVGQKVKHDDIIGYTGVSGKNGNNFTTRNPHLHFEITNIGSVGGLNGKCNALAYFKFKTETELSTSEKQKQLEIKNKEWN